MIKVTVCIEHKNGSKAKEEVTISKEEIEQLACNKCRENNPDAPRIYSANTTRARIVEIWLK